MTQIKSNPCKLCGSDMHTKAFCRKNPKYFFREAHKQEEAERLRQPNPFKPTPKAKKEPKPLVRKVPVIRRGKHAKTWSIVRLLWFRNNPPNEFGWYQCGICGNPVHYTKTTIDHIIPRSRAPHLRYEPSNLQPAHWICNQQKGSKVYEPLSDEDRAINLVEEQSITIQADEL